MQHELSRAADLIARSGRLVVLSGAGISTESGIPDFRGPNGLWSVIDPGHLTAVGLRRLTHSPHEAGEVISALVTIGDALVQAKPNPAHLALAELERWVESLTVITQNIDGLHQQAGSTEVIEVHGSYRTVTCMSCGRTQSSDRYLAELRRHRLPRCDCGGMVRPDVVLFGDLMPQGALDRAMDHAARCDTMLVVGSSLVVYPIAGLVDMAKYTKAVIIIINDEETAKDYLAEVVIRGVLGAVLPRLVSLVKQRAEASGR